MASILDILSGAGNLLDLPGSSLRDILAGRNPFDQWATPFSDGNRATGRDVLYPFLGANEETGMSGWMDNPMEGLKDMAGFGVEMFLDPMNLVPAGALTRVLKGRGAARKVNRGIDAVVQHPERMRLAKQMQEGFGESGTHTMNLLDSYAVHNKLPAEQVHGRIDVGDVQNPMGGDTLSQSPQQSGITDEFSEAAGKTARPWKTTAVYKESLKHIKAGDRVVDYGSGPYQYVKDSITGAGAEYVPFDRFGGIGSIDDLRDADVVMGSNVLNTATYSPDPQAAYSQAIREMAAAMKPGASLVVNMPGSGPRAEWMSPSRLKDDLGELFDDVTRKGDVVVARSPKAVQSPSNPMGGTDVLFQSPTDPGYRSEPFYSKIMEAVDAGKIPNRVGREQLLKTLTGYGVKQEELADMADDFDELFSGADKVSKDDVFALAADKAWAQNSVEELTQWRQPIEKQMYELDDQIRGLDRGISAARREGRDDVAEQILAKADELEMQMDGLYDQMDDMEGTPETGYSDYQIPGGNPGTYRELLLRNPMHKYDSHFKEFGYPDVQAHARVDEVTLPSGEKAMRIQEIQSDLHQKGAKRGYAGEDFPMEPRTALLPVDVSYEGPSLASGGGFQIVLSDVYETSGMGNKNVWGSTLEEVRKKAVERVNSRLAPRYGRFDETPLPSIVSRNWERMQGRMAPDAPFKKSWPDLMAKVILRNAAEKGYDTVTLAPGEAAARAVGGPQEALGKFYNDKMTNIISKLVKKGGGTVEKATDAAAEKGRTIFRLSPQMKEELLTKGQPLYQNPISPRGQIAFQGDRMRISPISPDASTAPHEASHAVRRMLQPEQMQEAGGIFGNNWDVPAEESFAQGAESWLQRTSTTSPAMSGTMGFFNQNMNDIYPDPMKAPSGADQLYSKIFGITSGRSPLDRASMPGYAAPAAAGAVYNALQATNRHGGVQ
jgi:hypothetical protein